MQDPKELRRVPWRPIEPLDEARVPGNGHFASLDALRAEWERHLSLLSEAERVKIRQRSLRRLSVETGIIERLYDVDWGMTLTLVAEGFTRDVVERAGGRVDELTLRTLQAQRDSLEMVLDFVRADRKLTDSFVKELHAALTRTQRTYHVTDALGRPDEQELPHGVWKSQPNHVLRGDGSLLEYAPPEQVQSEVDALIQMHGELDAKPRIHPVAKAAWFHHRFVQIHPFADGNGRVARALTLLLLERFRYAPLVVDRFRRDQYIAALDAAGWSHSSPDWRWPPSPASWSGPRSRPWRARPATSPVPWRPRSRRFAAERWTRSAKRWTCGASRWRRASGSGSTAREPS
jgi:hypothetical protein